MAVIECPLGHRYDSSLYDSCPFCGERIIKENIFSGASTYDDDDTVFGGLDFGSDDTLPRNGYVSGEDETIAGSGYYPGEDETIGGSGFVSDGDETIGGRGFMPGGNETVAGRGYIPDGDETVAGRGYMPGGDEPRGGRGYMPGGDDPIIGREVVLDGDETIGGRGYFDDGDATLPRRGYSHGENRSGSDKVSGHESEGSHGKKKRNHDQVIIPVVGWLVCIEGPDKGRSYELYLKTNTIGRSYMRDVYLKNDMTISRYQAKIAYDERHNLFALLPAENTNPIYLNDEPVYSPGKIQAYDCIEFGKSKYVFVPLCSSRFNWKDGLTEE
jgi:hypothetical protein